MSEAFEPSEYAGRLSRAADLAGSLGIDALLVTPGPDLRYLTGYHAHALERLTCLVLTASGQVTLVVPELEIGTAIASPISQLEIELSPWQETDDPYELTARILNNPSHGSRVAVDDRMWAVKALELRRAMPEAEQVVGGVITSELRMRKTSAEIRELQRAGAAIDRVHAQVAQLLRPGRTEAEVGRDIADAISSEHETVDFVIVASGPNGASPHHMVSGRAIEGGDAVVVDIGGTLPSGYCSDSTRTYAMGDPGVEFRSRYDALEEAQSLACRAVAPGMTCEEIDTVARDRLAASDLATLFIHRTGHGIGLETHEEPYIVAGNARHLEPGMAFSVEPGFYEAGVAGARIEDIVVCGQDGPVMCNTRPHELCIID